MRQIPQFSTGNKASGLARPVLHMTVKRTRCEKVLEEATGIQTAKEQTQEALKEHT